MEKKLYMVKLDTKYCDYLRKFDNKVPYNYGKKDLRPFVGVLFKVEKNMYFAPLSSPKVKHLKMKANLDLLKIDRGKLGVINFNNMLPVTEKNIIKLDLKKGGVTISEKKYIALLKKQLYWLTRNKERLHNKAKTLYDKYLDKSLDLRIAQRCCDFKLLEEKCTEYNSD